MQAFSIKELIEFQINFYVILGNKYHVIMLFYWKAKGTYVIVKQSNSQTASEMNSLRAPSKLQEISGW